MFIKKTYIYIYIAIQVTNITCFPNFFSKQNLKNILSTKSGKIGTCILASLISFSIYLKSEEIYYNYKKKIFIKEFISWFMSKANIVFNNKFLYPYLNKIKKKSLETYLKNIQSKKLIMHVQQLEKNYGLKQLQKQEILNQLLQQENKLLIQQVLQEIKSQPQEQLNQQIKQLQKQIEQLSQEIKQLEQKEEELTAPQRKDLEEHKAALARLEELQKRPKDRVLFSYTGQKLC